MNIRFTTPQDVESILLIYAQYIDTNITFEYKLPSIKQFAIRINNIGVKYPWLVLEEESKILGYAYAHEMAERDAYQWNAELSLYLDKNERGKKFGEKLYGLLLAILKLQGVLTVYARVTIPNIRSEHFHSRMGFKKVWTQHQAGFKNGQWHDIAWLAKNIGHHRSNPAAFIPLREMDGIFKEKILSDYFQFQ